MSQFEFQKSEVPPVLLRISCPTLTVHGGGPSNKRKGCHWGRALLKLLWGRSIRLIFQWLGISNCPKPRNSKLSLRVLSECFQICSGLGSGNAKQIVFILNYLFWNGVIHCAGTFLHRILVLELHNSASCSIEMPNLEGFGVKMTPQSLVGINFQQGIFKITPPNRSWAIWAITIWGYKGNSKSKKWCEIFEARHQMSPQMFKICSVVLKLISHRHILKMFHPRFHEQKWRGNERVVS